MVISSLEVRESHSLHVHIYIFSVIAFTQKKSKERLITAAFNSDINRIKDNQENNKQII